MIRHLVTPERLEELVRAHDPTWPDRARERTQAFRVAGGYREKSAIWGEVKPVYMALQHAKCAYCERRLAGLPYGTIEHDVEHYRPKSEVKRWPSPRIAQERQIAYDFGTGEEMKEGYYLLAYHPWNYATACKTCNSALKSSFFPVAGPRATGGEDPRRMKSEKPFLVYPLGDLDEDPETVITFVGILPVPRARSGHRFRRAQVTIDFFELDTREELLRERAEQLRSFHMALRLLETGTAADRVEATAAIENHKARHSPHAGCVRAFHALYERDRAEAEEIFALIGAYLEPQI